MKRPSFESETIVTTSAKRFKSNNGHGHANSYHSSYETDVRTANDRFANSIYKGKTLITKTPQKINFDDEADSNSSQQAHLRDLSRKKSVTFTPETKIEDGASGQTFAKLWLIGTPPIQDQQPNTVEAATEQPTPTKIPAKPASDTKTRPKQPKQSRSKKNRNQLDEHDERSACIKYLDQFHKDKANWKFNKSRQNDILRHVWNTEQIPPTSDDALVAYVAGLQGAASRQRLIEGATELLDPLLQKHADAVGTPSGSLEARKDAYKRAVQQELKAHADEQSDDEQRTLDSLGRAERLLTEALWLYFNSEQASTFSKPEMPAVAKQTTANTNIPPIEIKKKTRKSRTAELSESDSDSSSSESESESESGSDRDVNTSDTSDSDSSNGSSSDSE